MDGIYGRTWISILWDRITADICSLAYCVHHRWKTPRDTSTLGPLRSNQTQSKRWTHSTGVEQHWWTTSGSIWCVSHIFWVFFEVETPLVDNVPAAVHIFDFPAPQQEFTPRLRSILLHNNPVLNARWNPVRRGSLALCCGTQSIFIWNDKWVNEAGEEEEMAECICVPARTWIFIWRPCMLMFWMQKSLRLEMSDGRLMARGLYYLTRTNSVAHLRLKTRDHG